MRNFKLISAENHTLSSVVQTVISGVVGLFGFIGEADWILINWLPSSQSFKTSFSLYFYKTLKHYLQHIPDCE